MLPDSDESRASITGRPIRANIPPPYEPWDRQRKWVPLLLAMFVIPIAILVVILGFYGHI